MVRTTHEDMHIHIEPVDRVRRPLGFPWRPQWLGNHVEWYPHMAPFNIRDISSKQSMPCGSLYQVISARFRAKGVTQWEAEYQGTGMQKHWRSILFAAFDNTYIIEYTSKLAGQFFRALEVHMRVVSADTDICPELLLSRDEAKYEVSDYERVWLREDKDAADWWRCKEWRSIGQSPVRLIIPSTHAPRTDSSMLI